MLAKKDNGAIEVDSPTEEPLRVVLAGPIKVWWEPGMWGSELHNEYMEWRNAVQALMVQEGHLVYSPHQAWRGAWSEVAQEVNDSAIRMSHALVVVTPPGVKAEGTQHEMEYARENDVAVVLSPPGGDDSLKQLSQELAKLKQYLVDFDLLRYQPVEEFA